MSPSRLAADKRLRISSSALADAAPAEEARREYSLWPRYSVLDVLFLAVQAEQNWNELLYLRNKGSYDSLYCNRPLSDGVRGGPPRTYALSPTYIDESSGSFRARPGRRPDFYGIDPGMRLASEALGLDPTPEDQDRWLSTVRKTGVVLQHLLSNKRLCGDQRGLSANAAGQLTVFGAFSAASAIDCYNNIVLKFEAALPSIQFPAEKIAECLLGDGLRVIESGRFSFRQAPHKGGSLSSMEYACRTPSLLTSNPALKDISDNLKSSLETQKDGMLLFLKGCWSSEGGFHGCLDDSRPPDLGQTRYGLQLLRTLVGWGMINQLPEWFAPTAVLEFVRNRWTATDEYGGFSNREGDPVPSVYAARAAVNTVKVLELLRLFGCFTPDTSYNSAMTQLLPLLKCMNDEFIPQCVDRTNGLCYGYPVAMIDSRSAMSSIRWFVKASSNVYYHSLLHPFSEFEVDHRTGEVIGLNKT